MWESMLGIILAHVDIGAILTKIGVGQILPWLLANAKFFGSTFLAKMKAARADDEEVQSFLRGRVVWAEVTFPTENGFQRAWHIVTDPGTVDYFKAIGKDLSGSLLGTAIAECHQFIEPILPDLVSVFLATGKMPSATAITQMLNQKVQEVPVPPTA